MSYQHGVYVEEQATRIAPAPQGGAGSLVVLGTAPVHMADNPYACTNVPILLASFEDAKRKIGHSSDFKKYTVCQAVDACFVQYGVGPVIVINVLDPLKHKKRFDEETIPVTKHSITVMQEGVLLNKLVVKKDADELQRGTDYTAAFNVDGYPVLSLVPGGKGYDAAELVVSGEVVDASLVEATEVVGMRDAETGTESGMEVIRQVFPLLGKAPGLLIAPGWSHKSIVAAALQQKCEGINGTYTAECLTDIDSAQAVRHTQAQAVKESTGMLSEHCCPLWPKVAYGSTVYYYSAAYAALLMSEDAKRGGAPAVSGSNKLLRATALVREDGVEVYLDQEQANELNAAGITTALRGPRGFVAWGNNTAAYPGVSDPKDRWFGVRRFFSWQGNNFILRYLASVDDPANYRLIESIIDSENIYCNSLVAKGYIAGARITFSDENNPIEQIMDGKLVFEQAIAPYTPAEVILSKREYDVSMIESELFGGENA